MPPTEPQCQQALVAVNDQPGCLTKDVAAATGETPQRAYRILAHLAQSRRLDRRKRVDRVQWYPKGQAPDWTPSKKHQPRQDRDITRPLYEARSGDWCAFYSVLRRAPNNVLCSRCSDRTVCATLWSGVKDVCDVR